MGQQYAQKSVQNGAATITTERCKHPKTQLLAVHLLTAPDFNKLTIASNRQMSEPSGSTLTNRGSPRVCLSLLCEYFCLLELLAKATTWAEWRSRACLGQARKLRDESQLNANLSDRTCAQGQLLCMSFANMRCFRELSRRYLYTLTLRHGQRLALSCACVLL